MTETQAPAEASAEALPVKAGAISTNASIFRLNCSAMERLAEAKLFSDRAMFRWRGSRFRYCAMAAVKC